MNTPSTPDKTLTGLTVLFCVVFIGLAGRLVYIQGFRPDSPRYTLGASPARTTYVPAPRGELLDRRARRNWHAGLPDAPDGFLENTTFALRRTDAEYLKERGIRV